MSKEIELANWLTNKIIYNTCNVSSLSYSNDELFTYKLSLSNWYISFLIINPIDRINFYLKYFNIDKYFDFQYTNSELITYLQLSFKEEYLNEVFNIVTLYKLSYREKYE